MNESKPSTRSRTESVIRTFLQALGRECPELDDRSDLHCDVECSSDEGVLLVIELGEEFDIDLPADFNAVVDDSGNRGRTFGELVEKVESFVGSSEISG